MKITIQRHTAVFTESPDGTGTLRNVRTLGTLYIDGRPWCFTLEDEDRLAVGLAKVPGKTAIPAGTYELLLTFSNRFQRVMPQLMNVPGFTGIRIHAGNTEQDTEGCPLVGTRLGLDGVYGSATCFANLMLELRAATKTGKVTCEVRSE